MRRQEQNASYRNQGSEWPEFFWLKIGPNGGPFGINKLNSVFHKKQEIS
jgi:hypothetical protein